jgi:hypothetical protein
MQGVNRHKRETLRNWKENRDEGKMETYKKGNKDK